MHRFKPAFLLLCAGVLVAQVAPELRRTPHPYTMLYVFGDSYSDSGAGCVDANGPTAVVYLVERAWTFHSPITAIRTAPARG